MKYTKRKKHDINTFIEVNSAITILPKEEKDKIPKKLLDSIEKKAKNITIPIYLNKPLATQISRNALVILVCIATKYLFSNKEKEILKHSLIKSNVMKSNTIKNS